MQTSQDLRAAKVRRNDPLTVARNPDFLPALAAMNLPPWDAITSKEFAECAGVSPQTLADWRWRQDRAVWVEPPPEPAAIYAGRTRYYRVDVLTAWSQLDGTRMLDKTTLWPMAADYLHKVLGMRRPETRTDVTTMLSFLHENDIVRPRHQTLFTKFEPYEYGGDFVPCARIPRHLS